MCADAQSQPAYKHMLNLLSPTGIEIMKTDTQLQSDVMAELNLSFQLSV